MYKHKRKGNQKEKCAKKIRPTRKKNKQKNEMEIDSIESQRKQKKRSSERKKILERRQKRAKWLRTKIKVENEGC